MTKATFREGVLSAMAQTSQSRGVAVRQRIEQAAIELIAERGWGAVSTRMLADRAGVTPGLVHYHYRSLDDALRTAVVGTVRSMIDEFGRLVTDVADPQQAVDQVWAMLDRHPADGADSVLVLEATLMAMRDAGIRADLAAAMHQFRGVLAGRFADVGIAAPEQTAAVVAALIDGVMLHRILSDDLGADAIRPVVDRMLQTPAARARDQKGTPS